MRHRWFGHLCVCSALTLMGCAGVGVVARSDPKAKLADATYLFDRQDRPLIAERLIREAIEICEGTADQDCLAEAYRTYGFFFRSPSVDGKWSKQYREYGFLDKTATFDSRYLKSIEYFERARDIYARLEQFDRLTNVNLNIGFTYALLRETQSACRSFDESAANNRENVRRNPKSTVALPNSFASFDEFIAQKKKEVGC
jgi:tetratricopeptide (TPR) repeat protein